MSTNIDFKQLGLPDVLLLTLDKLGYEAPTSVQVRSIPILMKGADLLAQAQTGTGKTAAFALPILANLDLKITKPQAVVIAPTRELAIQVAEAFQSYGKELQNFHVATIFGGQDYKIQLKALQRGAHVIVGTPGRVMDHLRRGTLKMSAVQMLVLDEADEMLKMGFIDDVEWILEQIPHAHQTALFSATMPQAIQKISKRYLHNAEHVEIKPEKNTVAKIEQFYTCVKNNQKLDVLTRFLDVEEVDAAIIFARTKNGSSELADKLEARGYRSVALNGDMPQPARKKAMDRVKAGSLDILVATDVAARGIDIDRVTHVINYDIPYDTESYIHRIGRTGRAGRTGKALLLITPREHSLLKEIERAVGGSVKQMNPPSIKDMSEKRGVQLTEKVAGIIQSGKKIQPYTKMIEQMIESGAGDLQSIAAALAYLIQQSNPLPAYEINSAQPEARATGGNRNRSGGGFKHRSSSRRSGGGNNQGEKKPFYKKSSSGSTRKNSGKSDYKSYKPKPNKG